MCFPVKEHVVRTSTRTTKTTATKTTTNYQK